jgi:Domain of unknown function (DUF4124)
VVRISKILLPCMIGVALSATANAEIYESKDAQGNTVFSDMPSQGAAEVKVPPTNAADPVAITPRPPETPAKPRKSPANPAGSQDEERGDDYLYYGGDYDRDEIGDETRREKRRDDGEARPITDRPKVEPHRNTSRPAAGGGGRR